MAQTGLIIRQWATYRRTVTLKDANDDPINLTGFDVLAQIREQYKDTDPIASFTVTPNVDPATGAVDISLTSAETGLLTRTSWTSPTYVFDIILREIATNVRERVVEGAITVYPGVTR
jgi:hypothetical protein